MKSAQSVNSGAALTRARLLAMASGATALGAFPSLVRAQAAQALRIGVLSTESAAGPHYANDLGISPRLGST